MLLASSELSQESPLIYIFPPTSFLKQCRLLKSHTSEFFQPLLIIVFESHFHILRYLLQHFFLVPKSVLVPWGCWKKWYQTGWLKIIKIDSFTVLEARTLKSRCWWCHAPFDDSREELFLTNSSFWWFLAIFMVALNLCLCLHMAFFPSSLCLLLL